MAGKESEHDASSGAPGAPGAPDPAAHEPFGQRALRLGFLSSEDRDRALAEQRRRDAAGQPHQLIGMIMVETGLLTTTQLLAVLKPYEEERSG